MSFSSETKDELCRIRLKKKEHRLAVLAGLTQTCGTLRLSQPPVVYYQSENEAVIDLAVSLVSQLYPIEPEKGVKEQEHRQFPLSVAIVRGAACRKLLLDTGILSSGTDGLTFKKHIPDDLILEEQTRKCFLRGVFLGAGSCSDPEHGYHLEIACRSENFSESVSAVISSFQLNARSTFRKERPIVYLKGNDVSGFLALIGANSAALKMEDTRVMKDYRNYINRTSNCETANIGKTVSAGIAQLRAIDLIEEHLSLTGLPAPLQEAAMLRLQHPDATLQELADMAGIGKSGMNHRFARLLAIANEFEDIRNE